MDAELLSAPDSPLSDLRYRATSSVSSAVMGTGSALVSTSGTTVVNSPDHSSKKTTRLPKARVFVHRNPPRHRVREEYQGGSSGNGSGASTLSSDMSTLTREDEDDSLDVNEDDAFREVESIGGSIDEIDTDNEDHPAKEEEEEDDDNDDDNDHTPREYLAPFRKSGPVVLLDRNDSHIGNDYRVTNAFSNNLNNYLERCNQANHLRQLRRGHESSQQQDRQHGQKGEDKEQDNSNNNGKLQHQYTFDDDFASVADDDESPNTRNNNWRSGYFSSIFAVRAWDNATHNLSKHMGGNIHDVDLPSARPPVPHRSRWRRWGAGLSAATTKEPPKCPDAHRCRYVQSHAYPPVEDDRRRSAQICLRDTSAGSGKNNKSGSGHKLLHVGFRRERFTSQASSGYAYDEFVAHKRLSMWDKLSHKVARLRSRA